MKLPFPKTVLAQHIIALGKTGAGKSSKLRVLVEWLLAQGLPVCILDPKGDWFGLKSSADGRSPGFPLVIFGGEHADIPLNPHAGASVAELIFTGNRPCLIDLRGWMPKDRTRFFIDFASTVFKVTRGTRYLVIDEVHNFAPKGKVMSPEAGEMLHWANRLASEGRGLGLTLLAASQRPQKVHNDLLTSCETLIGCRVIHKADRDAIKDWIDGCADPTLGKQVLGELATMPRPEAWVWSPEVGFGPERVKFPLFETFDSFKPRSADVGKLKGWAEVDLEDVRARLATVVQEAEQNDPKLLKAEIARLKAEAAKAGAIDLATLRHAEQQATIAGRMLGRDEVLNAIYPAHARLTAALEALAVVQQHLSVALPPLQSEQGAAGTALDRRPTPAAATASAALPRQAPAVRAVPARRGTGPGVAMSKSARAILTVLAQRQGQNSTRGQLAILSGYSVTSSTFQNAMSELRVAGNLNGQGDSNAITDAGIQALGSYDPLPTGDALRQYWMGRLSLSERTLLAAICAAYPRPILKPDLAEASGYSETSSTFQNALSGLRVRELITRGDVKAADELFG